MTDQKGPNKDQIAKLLAHKKEHFGRLTPTVLFEKIKHGDITGLSESITLLESEKESDIEKSQELLKMALPFSGNSIRIGITGVPGVGKSTFIETFGMHLIEQGKKVAVLAIDPSSERSGGSILGDKTRMSELSKSDKAYIRPSSTAGSLGGVARKTRESIVLCEAAGFDVILVETVGVGQSEIAVHSMTDFFLLLMLAGAGDELQGIKRGIMEMADSILITKADGENVKKANLARSEYKNALHLFPPSENGWIPKVETVSAYNNKGIDKVWEILVQFVDQLGPSSWIEKKRKHQQEYWMMETLKDILLQSFYHTKGINEYIEEVRKKLNKDEITAYQASEMILSYYNEHK
ncbi:methylmalonyl Co-A mutase-associated GTPase MeaB [Paracrocinitomix mangrovi]|uniref:methylmalonyl Co-A mutase-associated GTPase MeaB n=1 Tax=Paracrocinitomix mangrovi TaxID=2862509 RepID=UPI001C8E61A6|nr:methylmalonyl Co-A mutase-associated GTPase MeaB [Paracrocinitomix mangrovi]UKN02916.1 methylmalonyl Co-A mutase-associated GTPase MeaB [Paracrocinitomix mangrovi]